MFSHIRGFGLYHVTLQQYSGEIRPYLGDLLCANVKGSNRHRLCVWLRVKSYGGHFVFCWEEFLSKCVVGGLENCEFKT